MNKIIAIGPREQDFAYTNGFFSGSITLYGSNKNDNISYSGIHQYRINHNVFSKDQGDFVENKMLEAIEADPNVQFMSYDPNQAYNCDKKIVEHTVCLNAKNLMDKLNHKISFRAWAKDVCRVYCSELLYGGECTYNELRKRYGKYDSFIVQADFATGGEGTFLLTALNAKKVEEKLEREEKYLVSGYEYYNIPINIHAIIYEEEILIFPVSVQIMRVHGDKLLYQGADFVEVGHIDESALKEFQKYMKNICLKLQKEGYRGVTGVDGMIVGKDVYILEMNNRFQGSTLLLNLALKDADIPSMQELNYESFNRKKSQYNVEALSVPYSCFTYIANEKGMPNEGHIRDFSKEKTVREVYDEGLRYDWKMAPYATLERVVFATNISTITDEGRVILHPNIPDMDQGWFEKIAKKNLLYLKIALINQGVILAEEAKKFLNENGGIREGVYNAVDIYLKDMIINSAVRVKFTALSPFHIERVDKSLILYCGKVPLTEIQIQKMDVLGERITSSGMKVKDLCLLATDRVRVQHSTNCHFKRCGVGCEFCEVENHEFSFQIQDVREAIDFYLDSGCEFRHFLIGGRSDKSDREADEILEIANYIRSKGDWPIYVMCVPPAERKILKRFYDAHVTEIALNIEIWNRDLARKWMPGKGAISRDKYLDMLEYATKLWGKTGNVRTAFIVGLEPVESLLEGVEEVCKLGVAPILSVFRPIPGTKGENFAPPENEELLSVYIKTKDICQKYGLKPGPECVPCQNNTLSMPDWYLSSGEYV